MGFFGYNPRARGVLAGRAVLIDYLSGPDWLFIINY